MPYQWLKRSKRKLTGGFIKKAASKKQRDLGNYPTETQQGKTKLKVVRTRGGNEKHRLLKAEFANVMDKETGMTKKVKISNVVENKANREYARRRIITKGCVLDTELGKAKVTSRPGQDGIVNAVLVEKKE